MKRKILASFLSVAMLLSLLPVGALADDTTSTPVAPVEITATYDWYSTDATEYTIDSVSDLAGLAKLTQGNVTVNGSTFNKTDFASKTVKLTADLNFGENQYWYYNDGTANGTVYDYRGGTFAGTFDGQGFSIKGLKFQNTKEKFNANMYLFNSISGTVQNLTLDGVTANINGYDNFGFISYTLTGTANKCHVKNVDVDIAIHEPNGNGYISSTGAMFGTITGATVTECTATTIEFTCAGNDNTDKVGALIGVVSGTTDARSTIKDCSVEDVTFDCTKKTKRTGGFVGKASNADFTDCTATNVKVYVDTYYQNVGGFVGSTDNTTYTNCDVVKFTMDCRSAGIAGDAGGFAAGCGSNVSFTKCSVSGLDMDLVSDNNGWGNGGFIGRQSGSNVTLTDCSVSGEITVTGAGKKVVVGGLIGYAGGDAALSDCEVAGSVTNTSSVASGLVGYVKPGANVTISADCTPAANITGAETNAIAGDVAKDYTYVDGTITSEATKWVCAVDMSTYGVGYDTIQEALNTGATTVYLLKDVTEDVSLGKNVEDETITITLAQGSHTLKSTITFPYGSFTVGEHTSSSDMYDKVIGVKVKITGGTETSDIKLAAPTLDHHIFLYWCSQTDSKKEPIKVDETDGFWKVQSGEFHTHWAHSSYVEPDNEEDLHLPFTKVYGGEITPDYGEFTFKPGDNNEGHKIVYIDDTDAEYFTASIATNNALKLEVKPNVDNVKSLTVGTYGPDAFHVTMEDGSVHTITAELKVVLTEESFELGAEEKPDTFTVDDVTVTKPATVNPENVVVTGGGKVGEVTVPTGVTVTIPGADLIDMTKEDTSITVGEDGTIKTDGGTTVTGPASLDSNGNVTIAAGGTITEKAKGETAGDVYIVPSGTAITVPSEKLDNVTTDGGTITLPEGSTITSGGVTVAVGNVTAEGAGVTVDGEGKITVSDDAVVKIGDTTITGPASVDANGNVTVEAGGVIKDSNGNSHTVPENTTITVPGSKLDQVTVDSTGNITLPGGSSVTNTETGVTTTAPSNGSVTIKTDGSVSVYKPSGGGRPSTPVVPVEPTPDTPAANHPFTDVAEGAWYADAVQYVYENGLMNGTADTTFDPEGTTTRSMIWTVLGRLAGETIEGADWDQTAQAWAMSAGVSDGTDPNGAVTREQLVTMLYRFVDTPAGTADLSKFADGATVSDYAQPAMVWAVSIGLLQGDDLGCLNPTATATRAEVATILMRFCEAMT